MSYGEQNGRRLSLQMSAYMNEEMGRRDIVVQVYLSYGSGER